MTEWSYFIGGPFDLTKRPKPTKSDDRYIHLAMSRPLRVDLDPDELARPVSIMSVTYRLATKMLQADGDVAWIYVCMMQP